jgi:hypothetical protein
MIEFTRSFKDSNGVCHASLAEAQHAELTSLLGEHTHLSMSDMATFLLNSRAKVVDILTMTVNSRPKARATNGGTKRRNPAKPPVVAPTTPPTPA